MDDDSGLDFCLKRSNALEAMNCLPPVYKERQNRCGVRKCWMPDGVASAGEGDVSCGAQLG